MKVPSGHGSAASAAIASNINLSIHRELRRLVRAGSPNFSVRDNSSKDLSALLIRSAIVDRNLQPIIGEPYLRKWAMPLGHILPDGRREKNRSNKNDDQYRDSYHKLSRHNPLHPLRVRLVQAPAGSY